MLTREQANEQLAKWADHKYVDRLFVGAKKLPAELRDVALLLGLQMRLEAAEAGAPPGQRRSEGVGSSKQGKSRAPSLLPAPCSLLPNRRLTPAA